MAIEGMFFSRVRVEVEVLCFELDSVQFFLI